MIHSSRPEPRDMTPTEQDRADAADFAADVAGALDDVETYLADPACDEPVSADLVRWYGWSVDVTDAVCAALGVL